MDAKDIALIKALGGGGSGSSIGVQSDWNQNDATQPDYIKNRPFYAGDLVETEIFDVVALMDSVGAQWVLVDGHYQYVPDGNDLLFFDTPLVVGDKYIIQFNGATYECTAVDAAEAVGADGAVMLGDSEEILCGVTILCVPYSAADPSDTSGRWVVLQVAESNGILPTELKVIEKKQEIKKIDKIFLPDELNGNFVTSINGVVADEKRNVNLTPKDIGAAKLFVVTETTAGTVDKSGEQIRDAYLDGYVVILVPRNGNEMMYLLTVGRKGSLNPEGYKFFSVGISSDIDIPYFRTATIHSNTVTYKTENLARYVRTWDSIRLNSSTKGSTKMFSITVDDSGTITATEV